MGWNQPARQDTNEDYKREERRIREVYTQRAQSVAKTKYSFRNAGNVYIQRELETRLICGLRRLELGRFDTCRVLDVGCGTGIWLDKFLSWGARPTNLSGIDLLPDRLARARKKLPAAVSLQVANATSLNFADASFDLVLQFTVFSSIVHRATRVRIANEILRVLKPVGHLVWYDMFINNPWNANTRALGKREIHELFPGCKVNFQRVTIAAPIARAIGKLAPVLCPLLGILKPLCTHYLAFLEKPAH